jgi:hypothetical protein
LKPKIPKNNALQYLQSFNRSIVQHGMFKLKVAKAAASRHHGLPNQASA